MKSEIQSVYLSPKGLSELLLNEIGAVIAVHDRLIFSSEPFIEVHWAQNIWKNTQIISFESINDASKKLKTLQKNWCLYSFTLHRRAKLIQDKLNLKPQKPLAFPKNLPKNVLGSWCLLDENTLLASTDCSSPFPNGEPIFIQDKKGPPNRAYLKLFEALTLAGQIPRPGEFCIDIGGSPGGWTWVIQKCGAEVLSIDRSPLDKKILNLKNVVFEKRDAFSLLPEVFKKEGRQVDWLFSDLICYPEKLYDWLSMWIDSGICKNFICTLKFKGQPESGIVKKFSAIPNSKVIHLFHNKNELTFIKLWRLA
jgi:23S rRNA (cytidine2498-2'-O)-methyltransferase